MKNQGVSRIQQQYCRELSILAIFYFCPLSGITLLPRLVPLWSRLAKGTSDVLTEQCRRPEMEKNTHPFICPLFP